ncbi:DUF2268 domain-containing putative Zn-dependent protease [Cronobacter muytjensii]|uniref:DUF2268 domain-containing protein n=1 Tax=Cronobacter muytjensii TaxID=413501 RepID=A0A2T7B0G0_9ENTR|nr:DUF2268 domain-containing putative Zn-dependent protease [Cronobacter muytjensii]KAB0876199.1 DUF2268 domain-containing protein [Cronobacter muytjensii]MBF4812992.1 hypothetical protein [Cronobacter muytjensii]PUX18483.1 hypothetical protein AUN14_00730 [Cronobacter muytjensii]
MQRWTIHWLEAQGDLSDYRARIHDETAAAYETLAAIMMPPRLDILVHRAPGQVIPEIGLAGRAYHGALFSMGIDPHNPHLTSSLTDGTLRRQILHEVHHCMRMAGPGYGWTPGEALVSEGLAGQFVTWLMGSAPEPWERALESAALTAAPVSVAALGDTRYDHAAWFFGTGALPRWYGYTLGYEMVGAWLEEVGTPDAERWVTVSAQEVIGAARRHGLLGD